MKTSIIPKFSLTIIVMFVVMVVSSCDDFVDTPQPNSQLTTAAVFANAGTADAAMADVYAQMRENGLISGRSIGMSVLLGVYSDELISFENGAYTTADFYNNSLLASNELVSTLWNESYNQIYAANSVIEGVANSATLAEEDRSRLTGEALFARAFIHFNLVNLFGAVPYIKTTDYTVNRAVPKMQVDDVYAEIIADLELAETMLPSSSAVPLRTRPDKVTAQAMLARVYLYNDDFAQAADMASAVLNNETYQLQPDISQVFLNESAETIWQLTPGNAGANTDEATTFIFHTGPPYTVALSGEMVSDFESGDLRQLNWIREVTDGTTVWYHPYKYKQDLQTGSSVEYPIVMRVAEQYLIRAEARARQGELTAAREDINSIRNRAGLADTDAVSQSEILDAVLNERRFELFSEHGHRFFDLKRFNKLDEVLNSKPGWEETDQLWPLPQSEMLANPLLTPQNPGY